MRHENGEMRLIFPLGVVVPRFYVEESDIQCLSLALQLGAEGIAHLKDSATETKLKELIESRTKDLTKRAEKSVSERQQIEKELRESWTQELSRKLREQREEHESEVLSRFRAEQAKRAEEVGGLRAEIQEAFSAKVRAERRSENLEKELQELRASFEGQREVLQSLRQDVQSMALRESVAAEAAREEERKRFEAQRKSIEEAAAKSTEFAHGLLTQLRDETRRERELASAQVAQREAELKLKEAEVGLMAQQQTILKHNSCAKGARGECELLETVTQAFNMAEGFAVRNTSKDNTKSGDMLVCLWGMQTLWDCKTHEAKRSAAGGAVRNIETKEADQMKRDLLEHPEVSIGFLVGMHTGFANHAECAVDLETFGHQTLVYINRFAQQENPVVFLQTFIRPLLQALHGKSRPEPVESVKLHVQSVLKLQSEVEAESTELFEEKKFHDKLFGDRSKRLNARRDLLRSLVVDLQAAQVAP